MSTSIIPQYAYSDTFLEKFWAKVKTPSNPDECWIWTASTSGRGYGRIWEKKQGKRKLLFAHHVSWKLSNGEIPKGLQVLHKCDNPPCVNPFHLFLGTHQDNMTDKVKKGRQLKGESAPTHVLTVNEVKKLRNLYGTGEYTQSALAGVFSITQTQVGHIVRGEQWANDDYVPVSFSNAHRGGVFSGNAKLNEEKVAEIRRLYAAGGILQRELGKMFDVPQTQISRIVRGESWIISYLDDE